MWFLLVIGLDVASIVFVGATARAGRSVLPGPHVTLALAMVVMALFGGIPRGRELLPIVLIVAAAAVLVRRGRCSQPTCWHLIACALGMGLLALEMPSTGAHGQPMAMAGMTMPAGSGASMGSSAMLIGWIVLAAFFLVSAFEAAVLVERLPRPALLGVRSSLTLERLALLTGSLAMVAMAAGMLAGAAAPIAA
jgi:hypothetical protein